MLVIGIMSGTSADGVDAALVELRGNGPRPDVTPVGFIAQPFEPGLRDEILDACEPSRSRIDRLCVLQVALAEAYARAALTVAHRCGVAMADIAALACHGQTVWHQPSPARCGDGEYRGTMQIVSAATLAARTGCPVVSDFRTADMAAGGQGAPLVPYADWVLLSRAGEARIMLNIGGIANVTYLPSCDRLDRIAAFDTGPGNMVVDGVVRVLTHGAKAYDVDGAWAAAGRPSQVVVESVMATCPFLRQPPPRSTGREQFGRAFVEETFLPSCREARLSDADTVATATSLTAHTIADALSRWPIGETPADQNVADARATVIVGGGGARNSTMMRMLAERLAPARLTTHEEFGIPNDAKEAIAFAILGYATLCGLPSNVPSATGAAYPAVLGSITPAPGRAAAKSGRGDRGATSGD